MIVRLERIGWECKEGVADHRRSGISIRAFSPLTIPNFISLARLFLVPVIVYLIIIDRYMAAGVLFVLAGVSDAVDGFIAKRFGQASQLGAYLDPLADKALLVSVFVTFGLKEVFAPWLVVLVVSRDILIVGAVILAWMLGNPISSKPLLISKANTAAQIVLVTLAFGVQVGLTVLAPLILPVSLAVAALTVLSAGLYVNQWLRHMAGGEAHDAQDRH
jgi:cardiolipin synthase (CMP-forming)